jgi:hypothetical protein
MNKESYFADENDTYHWYEFIMDWEIPSKWHFIHYRRWRNRHRRISTLENQLKIVQGDHLSTSMRYKIWGWP